MLSEQQALGLLQRGAVTLEPLKIQFVQAEEASGRQRPDWLVAITFDGKTNLFWAEYSRNSTPRSIGKAIAQLQRLIARRDVRTDSPRPLLIAPYFTEATIGELVREQISGIDLSGNGVIYVPGEWFVLRTGAANRYPASSPIKRVYEGKSSLVGRVLIDEREFDSVNDVLDAIVSRGGKISLATVSKVLTSLEEELIISKKPTIRLLQPHRLLANLREGFRPTVPVDQIVGKATDRQGFLQMIVNRAADQGIDIAVDGRDRYVLLASSRPVTTVYVSDLENLGAEASVDTGSPFPDVEIISTRDPLVLYDLQWQGGIPWTPPLQVYLELANGDKRERETAEQLLDSLLQGRESG